jgi:nucleoid DNA-binding protein
MCDMNVPNYICSILYKEGEVVLPNFGEFKAIYQSAQIDSRNNVFTPPTNVVVFTTNSKSDGKLAKRICSSENMSEDTANLEIKKVVDKLKDDLNSKGNVILPLIGKFTQTNSEAIKFIPDRSVNYNVKSYGLSEIQSYPVVRQINVYEDDEETGKEKVKKVKKSKRKKKEKQSAGGKFNFFGKGSKSKSLAVYLCLVALLVILLIIQMFTWDKRPTSISETLKALADIVSKESTNSLDVIDSAGEYNDELKKKLHSVEGVSSAEPVNKQPSSKTKKDVVLEFGKGLYKPHTKDYNKKIFVILNQFKDEANASNFEQKLKKLDYVTGRSISQQGLFRVGVRGFKSKEEAVKAKPFFEKKYGNYVWVLIEE